MDLLKAFLEYVPDDIYKSFTYLDLHNFASTHRDLETALDEKNNQRRQLARIIAEEQRTMIPTETQRADARRRVDHARSALMDEPEVLEDLVHAVSDFKECIRTYLTMFHKRRPSYNLIEELKPTFTKTGTWYTVSLSKYSWVDLDIRFMGLVVTYKYTRGKIRAHIRDSYYDSNPSPMDISWKESLSLAVALLEHIDIPYVLDMDMLDYEGLCPGEKVVYECLKHKCL